MDQSMEEAARDNLFLQVLIRLSVVEKLLVDKGIISLEELEKNTEEEAMKLTKKVEQLMNAQGISVE